MEKVYEVESNFVDTNCTMLVEPYHNTEGSEYIVGNMQKLSAIVHHMPEIDEFKADDLLGDVYLSILKAEENGNGFVPMTDENGNTINPEQWVISRIKMFAKNAKYKKGASDVHATTRKRADGTVESMNNFYTYSTNFTDEYDDGNGMTISDKNICNISCMASGEEVFDEINEIASLRQSIDFCIDFSSVVNFNFMNLFKNIDMFKNMNICKDNFEKLREALDYHDELKDALMNVLHVCAINRVEFDRVIASYAA